MNKKVKDPERVEYEWPWVVPGERKKGNEK